MSKYTTLLLVCITLFVSACSPVPPTIRSNSNPSVDITQYKTFGFFDKLDTDYRYESLVTQYLKQASKQEMIKRGFTFSNDNPDLLINFSRQITDKQEIRNLPAANQGRYYNYSGQIYYETMIGYEPYIDNYQHGKLAIDIVDRQQNKMIWQGVAEGRVTEQDQSNLKAAIPKVVADIFKQFPTTNVLSH
jgi:hypothetical protein